MIVSLIIKKSKLAEYRFGLSDIMHVRIILIQ